MTLFGSLDVLCVVAHPSIVGAMYISVLGAAM